MLVKKKDFRKKKARKHETQRDYVCWLLLIKLQYAEINAEKMKRSDREEGVRVERGGRKRRSR